MQKTSITLNWEVHDNWTEILAGTYFLLHGPFEKATKSIPSSIIARLIIILSHQLVEVMFFNVISKHIDNYRLTLNDSVIIEIESGFKNHIGIKSAMKSWPTLLVGRSFDISRESFSSQERLRDLRNESIHWPSGNSAEELAHSAYYTGVQASIEVYTHFFKWEDSEYAEFVKRYAPIEKTYLIRTLQKIKEGP